MKTKVDIAWIVIGFIVFYITFRQCEGDNVKIVTKTETIIETVTDTITEVVIQKVPGPKVYIEKIKVPKSGAFLFIESNFNKKPDRHAIGIDYQIKNKLLIGTSVSYNTITNNVNMNFKVGFKIF